VPGGKENNGSKQKRGNHLLRMKQHRGFLKVKIPKGYRGIQGRRIVPEVAAKTQFWLGWGPKNLT